MCEEEEERCGEQHLVCETGIVCVLEQCVVCCVLCVSVLLDTLCEHGQAV